MDTIVEQEKTDKMSKSLLRRLTVFKLKGGNFIGEHRNNGRICEKFPKEITVSNYSFKLQFQQIPKGNYSFNYSFKFVLPPSILHHPLTYTLNTYSVSHPQSWS